jgi:hypothetical protein
MLSVKDHAITTATGMKYKVLVLDSNSTRMTLPVAKAIYQLVKDGATVVGPRPTNNPSLAGNNQEYKNIINSLWGGSTNEKSVGKGKAIIGTITQAILANLHVTPDFSYNDATANLLYVHRKLNDRDIYWVNNRKNTSQQIEATFRVSGKAVEIWHPETGKAEKASYQFDGQHTKVKLDLIANDAVFVIFKDATALQSFTKTEIHAKPLTELNGVWDVHFQKDRGAPAFIQLKELKSLSESDIPGVKYFSGIANYTNIINVKDEWLKQSGTLYLDLGVVKELAEVFINGKSIGIVWKAPYRIDLGNTLKVGENKIEIKVANLWVNRLIGDQQPKVEKKITYTTMPFYTANSTLTKSGLLGPVKIEIVQ